MIIDYKMKLELGKELEKIRETGTANNEFRCMHGCYARAQVGSNQRNSEVLDLWSEDTKHDAFFTQCIGHLLCLAGEGFPGFSMYLFSG